MQSKNKTRGRESCEVCGREQQEWFEVHLGGERHIFDTFECAINGMMPKCSVCGSMILGTGVQMGDLLYCGDLCVGFNSVQEDDSSLYMGEQPKPSNL